MEISYPIFEYHAGFKDNATPWSGHKCFGYNLVKYLDPGVVVELGTWKGTSFYSFCQAVKDSKGKTKLVAIDTWQGDMHTNLYGDKIFNDFLYGLNDYYKTLNATYLRKNF